MKLVAVMISALVLLSSGGAARALSPNPERSVLAGIDVGLGLNPGREARTPLDFRGLDDVEAYSLAAFMLGVKAAFRWSELVGIEGGWHFQQHHAPSRWGDIAYFQVGRLALRLAWPTRSRQTLVFKLGPAVGGFVYGASKSGYVESNGAIVVGGMAGVTLEHEFALGIVGTVDIGYFPLYRFGMDGPLYLVREQEDQAGRTVHQTVDSKDFSSGQAVHLLLIAVGVQFEWLVR